MPKGYTTISISLEAHEKIKKISKEYRIPMTKLIEFAVLYYHDFVLKPMSLGYIPPQLLKRIQKYLAKALMTPEETAGGGEG